MTSSRRPFRVDGAFDIECADWDKFVLGATYDGQRSRVYYSGDQMIDDMRERGGVWFAHAGGVYDLLYVLDRVLQRGISCQADRSQHRITRIVMGSLTLRDSYSLWPAPLGELCGAIGAPEPALPWPCICRAGGRKGCGGYCQIAARAAVGDPDLEEYCKSDARVLYQALCSLGEWTASRGIALRGTLAQTAWIAAQDELGIPKSEMPFHLWRHVRQADKGGRGAIIRPTSVQGVLGAHHDICSAYPAQLAKTELPVGACRELGGQDADRALRMARPGIYTASVRVPEMFLPPLPWHKLGQLCFPVGTFTGSWTLPELAAALDRGVELLSIYSAVVWEATAPVFAPLVERWYELRRSAGRKTPIGKWMAALPKALTGKFAERPDRQRVVFYPAEIKICTRQGACRHGCTHRCGAYDPLDLYGHVWGVPYHRLSDSAYPQWSAYLRSLTRVQWLSQAERMGRVVTCGACGAELETGGRCADHPAASTAETGGGTAIRMGNTDSLWHTSRQEPEPLGDGLGEWEYQHAWTDLDIRTLTVYAYRDPADGEFHIRGIPGLTEEDWRRGAGRIDRGIVTFGRAVKTARGLFHKRHRRWKLPRQQRVWYGDRKIHSDGLTYPADADELRGLAREVEERRRLRERPAEPPRARSGKAG